MLNELGSVRHEHGGTVRFWRVAVAEYCPFKVPRWVESDRSGVRDLAGNQRGR
jgi:hypothetical protein